MRGYEVHRNEPFPKEEVGVLKDSAYLAREIPLASVATELLVLASGTMMSTAVRADNILSSTDTPSFLDDCLSANVLVGEVVHNLYERIELLELYHSWSFLYVLLQK